MKYVMTTGPGMELQEGKKHKQVVLAKEGKVSVLEKCLRPVLDPR